MAFRILQKLAITILFIFIGLSIHGQELKPDSIKRVWQNEEQTDINRLKALSVLIKQQFQSSKFDSILHFADLQFQFANKKGLKKYMAKSLNSKGRVFAMSGDYKQAINYFTQSMEIWNVIQDDYGIASSLNNIGIIYKKQGNYTAAITYFTRSLSIKDKLVDKKGVSTALINIGTIHSDQGNYEEALKYYNRSLKIDEDLGLKRRIPSTLNNIGNVYGLQSNYTKALEFFQKSLKIKEELGDKLGQANSLGNIAIVYEMQKEYEKALRYFMMALKINEESKDRAGICEILNNLGILNFELENYEKAMGFSKQALIISQELGYVMQIREAAENLYRSYKHMGNPYASLEMHELYINMRDSLENIDAQKETIRQKFQYEYEKQTLADSISFVRQKEIDSLKHQKEYNILITTFGILLISSLILVFYFRIRFIRKKSEEQILLKEIKVLKAESVARIASSSLPENSPLDRDKIEASINGSLNESDWNIIKVLYDNPIASNSEIAEKVSLSIDGTRSSLKKMYRLFEIEKTGQNQRIELVIQLSKLLV